MSAASWSLPINQRARLYAASRCGSVRSRTKPRSNAALARFAMPIYSGLLRVTTVGDAGVLTGLRTSNMHDTGHVRMQGAEVGVVALVIEMEAEAVAGIEPRRVELAVLRYYVVHCLIAIGPGHSRAARDRQLLRFELKLVDLHRSRLRGGRHIPSAAQQQNAGRQDEQRGAQARHAR